MQPSRPLKAERRAEREADGGRSGFSNGLGKANSTSLTTLERIMSRAGASVGAVKEPRVKSRQGSYSAMSNDSGHDDKNKSCVVPNPVSHT